MQTKMKSFKPKKPIKITSKDIDRLVKEGIEIAKSMEAERRKNRGRVQEEERVLGFNPPPKIGEAQATWELVIDDMYSRDVMGEKKYGVRHQHDNGRNHLQDLYEELLDASVYTKAHLEKSLQSKSIVNSVINKLLEIRETPQIIEIIRLLRTL